MKYLIFFICFSGTLIAGAQSFRIGNSLDFKKRDIFFNTDIYWKKDKHQLGIAPGFGIIRAFEQQRFFPQAAFLYDYSLVERQYFRFAVNNTMCYSTAPLSRLTGQRLYVLENYYGFSLEAGKRIRFRSKLLGGLYHELVQPAAYKIRKIDFGYQFSIGVVYDL